MAYGTVKADGILDSNGNTLNIIDVTSDEATTSAKGYMSAADKTKLDGVEAGATADQNGAEIKALYEAESDTNAFTDADHTKLDGIETGAEVNTVTSVNTATGAVVLDADDIDDASTTNKFVTAADITALGTLSSDLAGKADLSGGKLDTSQLPDLAISEYKGAVADQTAMLAISGEKGDWVIRNDDSKVYVITGTNPASASDWTALSYPTGGNADTLDSLDSTQFLRSDASDTATGNITFEDSTLLLDNTSSSKGPWEFSQAASGDLQVTISGTSGAELKLSADGSDYTTANLQIGGNNVLTTADEGSGNGIDADTVDGLEASQFLRSDQADTITQATSGTSTLIVENTGGFGTGTGTGAKIAEFKGDSDGIVIRNINTGDYGIYSTAQDTGLEIYDGTGGIRILYGGTTGVEFDSGNNYGDFKGTPTVLGDTIWHAGNDGTGSTLDADTVDGLEASQFLRSDTGDTMTGDLTLSDNTPQLGLSEADTTTFARMILTGSKLYIQSGASGSGASSSSGDISFGGYANADLSSFTVRSGGADQTIWHAGNDGSGTGLDADLLDGQEGSYYQNASNLNAGTISSDRFPATWTRAGKVTIQATGATHDVLIDAADHILLEAGEEEDGNIYFRGNGGADSYRFSKSGQTTIEGFLSFESLTADRTFTYPDADGTVALTSDLSNYLSSTSDDSFTGTITGQSDGTNPVFVIDGNGPNIVRFLDQGSTTLGIDLVYRVTPNTLGFEKSTDGSNLWETDCDTGETEFHYTINAPIIEANGEITASAAALQVNGFMRTGSIYIHEGGGTPNASNSLVLGNSSGSLTWDDNTVWHAGNDGASSGLDADTLDGQQGSSYLRSNANDTMTGRLTIDRDNDASGALRITANQTNPDNDFYFAQEIVSTLSGTTATTGDREQGGLWIDINSSATGGGTDNEHRAYGVYVDLDVTGDSDVAYGVYADATATPTTGQVTEIAGGYFRGEDNGGAGAVSNVYGVRALAVSDNSNSDTNNLFGSHFKVAPANDTANISVATACYAEIEIIDTMGDHLGDSYVFRAVYDDNDGVAQTNTTYLFHGDYTGTNPTNLYGIYIAEPNAQNYFAGAVELDGNLNANASVYIKSELNLIGDADANKFLDVGIGTNTFHIRKTSGGDTGHQSMIEMDGGGGVRLYDNNTVALETGDVGGVSAGVIIYRDLVPDTDRTGQVGTATAIWGNGRFEDFYVENVLTVAGAIDLPDNDILRFGTNDDVEFFFNGTHFYLDLNSGGNNFIIRDGTTTRYTFDDNGDLTTTGDFLTFGDGAGTQVFRSNCGAFDQFDIKTRVGTTDYLHIRMYNQGSLELYSNGVKKAETTGSGMTVQGTVNETSDSRYKTNIQPITDACDKVDQLNGVTYNFIEDGTPGVGVIAQDVELVFPELVETSNEGEADEMKSVSYSGLIGLLIEAVKELKTENAALKQRLDDAGL